MSGSVADYSHLATAYRLWTAYEAAFDSGPTTSLAKRCDEAWLNLACQAVHCDRSCLRQPSLLAWIERRVEQTAAFSRRPA
jgi:hypothetical protein